MGLVISFARKFWGYEIIRGDYQGFDDFLEDIKNYVALELDYYDPKRVGRKNRTAKVSTFIGHAAEWFCLKKFHVLYRKRLRQIPLDREGMEIEAREKVARVETSRASNWELARIPSRTRSFLRNLGLNINDVAKDGYEGFKDLIIRIASEPRTDLSEKEKFVVSGRLEGKSLELVGRELAQKFKGGATKERARQLEAKAITKIKRSRKLTKMG